MSEVDAKESTLDILCSEQRAGHIASSANGANLVPEPRVPTVNVRPNSSKNNIDTLSARRAAVEGVCRQDAVVSVRVAGLGHP